MVNSFDGIHKRIYIAVFILFKKLIFLTGLSVLIRVALVGIP